MNDTESITQKTKKTILHTAIASLVFGMPALVIFLSRFFIFVFPDRLDLMLINIMGVLGICGLLFSVATVAKISRLSLAVVILVVVILFILNFVNSHRYYKSDSFWAFWALMRAILYAGVLLIVAAGVVCVRASKTKGFLTYGIIAFVGLVLTSFICLAWISLAYWYKPKLPCRWTIFELGQAMKAYARKNNDQFPDPKQWCDILLKSEGVGIENFICPSIDIRNRKHERLFLRPVPKVGRCQFAMNPSCKRDSPEDTVLLFEAKEGWNH